MGCTSSSSHNSDDMIGVGSYKNLNPYLAKRESAIFRQRVADILDSVRLQGLGGGGGMSPSVAIGKSPNRSSHGGSRGGAGRSALLKPSGISLRAPALSSGDAGSGSYSSASCIGACGVVQGSEDEHGQPLEITQNDLRSIAAVLRVFDAPVQNEIVGACLLARPADVHAFAYDYSKSCVLTIRVGGSNVGTVVSAAVVTLRIIDETTRCLEVSWVATLREHRKRGYAALLFGYIQQIAAVMGIEAVLVLSSRTSVGYWLNQPRAQGHKRIIMVRSSKSSKRLSKGYSKYPWKKRKLENGLRRADVYEEPPPCVQKFYDANSSFRFNHSNSIHVWYLLGLAHVDYLSLSRVRVGDVAGIRTGSRFRLSQSKGKGGKGGSQREKGKMSTRDKLKSKHGALSSSNRRRKSRTPDSPSSERPKRSKSWSEAGGAGPKSTSEQVSRSSSFSAGSGASSQARGSAYKLRDVSAAKLMARRIKRKADTMKKKKSTSQQTGSVYSVVGDGTAGEPSKKTHWREEWTRV